ncbi:MAG: MATE family efflux transporter [Emcibacteraceae bacterium]|nr:MATE family efflux transporter [Emcibacteraceae bacterium]
MSDQAKENTSINSRRVDLTKGSVNKHLIRMALPMIIGLTASMSYTFVDSYFIARLGTNEVAAMGFVSRMVMIIFSVAIGLSAGVTSVLARVAGSGDQEEVKRLATNTLLMTFILSLCISIFGYLTIDPIFTAMGANAEVLPHVRDYMMIWYLSPLFVILPMTGGAVMRALGDTKLQGNLMLLAAFINAALDPLLIFGMYGFPELGFAGAAWASLITRFFSFSIILYALIYRYHVICFSKKTIYTFGASLKRILHVGIPATGTNIIIPIVAAMVISIVARYGTEAVAATHVATTIEMISLVLFFSTSAVVGPFIGQNLGAKNFDRIDECIKSVSIFCIVWGLFVASVIATFAPTLAGLFRKEPEIIALAQSYLYVVPISYGLYGIVMSVNAMFNSLGKPMPAVAISTLRVFILQLPLFYFASKFYGLEVAFMTITASNIIAGVIGYIWIKRTIADLRTT